jgi:hypothetical protein
MLRVWISIRARCLILMWQLLTIFSNIIFDYLSNTVLTLRVGSVLFIFLVFCCVFIVLFIWLSFFVLCAQCCYWSLDCSLFIAYVVICLDTLYDTASHYGIDDK